MKDHHSLPRVCFFLGPSIRPADVYAECTAADADIRVLPPVQQGDLLRLLSNLPDVIGIVDGYFFQVPSVLHKEIMLAMERGSRVLGAASLGALRAAELHVFGMEGIGEIFRLYQQGIIDGDDEVAVLHAGAEDGFRPLTEPLINIRHNLLRAQAQRVITARTAAIVLTLAKGLHFTERSYKAIFARMHKDAALSNQLVGLRAFLDRSTVDLKREDTLTLVRTVIRRISGIEPWPETIPIRVNETKYFHLHCREYVGHWLDGQHVPEALVLSFQKLLSPLFPELLHRVTTRCLAVDVAQRRGLTYADANSLIDKFRRLQSLLASNMFQSWLDEHCMSEAELAVSLREQELEEQLLTLYRSYRSGPASPDAWRRQLIADVAEDVGLCDLRLTPLLLMRPGLPWEAPLLRELKWRGQFRSALALAGSILHCNAELSRFMPGLGMAFAEDRLEQWYTSRWGIERTAISMALADRGFSGRSEFIQTARLAYVYEHFDCLPSVAAHSVDAEGSAILP